MNVLSIKSNQALLTLLCSCCLARGASGGELVLHKVPALNASQAAHSSTDVALVSYKAADVHPTGRALYVSSGDDLKTANNMVDDQLSTAYAFSRTDAAPTAVIDLGKTTTLRRISAVYARALGQMEFFVTDNLPGLDSTAAPVAAPSNVRLADTTVAAMKRVGLLTDANGRGAIDFPETAGRYIVLKWTPATEESASFSVAEIAAFGGNKQDGLLAANAAGATNDSADSDGKTVLEGKDLGEGKDIPAEEAPAEGPAPALPPPPPFTFVPELVPTSP